MKKWDMILISLFANVNNEYTYLDSDIIYQLIEKYSK